MNLEELRAKARAVASRMEARLGTALGENRELNAEEQTANGADEAELADLKGQITAAEAAGGAGTEEQPADPQAAAVTAAVAAERERVLGLVDLCPASVVSSTLRSAIDKGVGAGAFAIDLAKASKARGASIGDLKAGAVQPEQLPITDPSKSGTKPPAPGSKARGQSIAQLAAGLGMPGFAHLKG